MILLDTHAWIWFVSNPELLSEKAEEVIQSAMDRKAIFLSSISAWEVAILVSKKRLKLTMDIVDWIAKSEALPFIKFLPVNNTIAVKSVNLPQPFHKDPADRILVATALTEGIPLLTKDEKIVNYPHVHTIW